MEKNVGRLRDVVRGKSRCHLIAGQFVAPFWLFEMVSDFFQCHTCFSGVG